MKKNTWKVIVLVLVILAIGGGTAKYVYSSIYKQTGEVEYTDKGKGQVGDAGNKDSKKVFTLDELAQYDGQNGNAAYIAIDKVVYDVSDISEWRNGQHYGAKAGEDLTEAFKNSPHAASILDEATVVGSLSEN